MSDHDITARVRTAFKRSGLTRAEMASACAVSRVAVTYWLNGKRIPNRESLEKFAAVCGMPVSRFYERGRVRGEVA